MFTSISKEHIIRRIQGDNPWWATGSIEDEFKAMPERLYLDQMFPILEDINLRRAVVLMGPRRVGKSVMIRHAIQKLLNNGVYGRKIFYLSIDTPIYTGISLETLFEYCQEAVHDFSNEGFYMLYDEVQSLKGWEVDLKSLVDRFRKCKFLASGSAAAALKMKSNESGAGRFTDFMLPPLTFYEYLVLQNIDKLIYRTVKIPFTTNDIESLNIHFIDYINFGGYPEMVFNRNIRENPERFIKNDILDKSLLRDLPGLYGISDVQELYRLFATVAYNSGNEFSLEGLSETSQILKSTIKKYLEYLEAAYLIKLHYRVDMSGKKFKRANFFKIYLTNPSMRSALFSPIQSDSEDTGNLVETALISQNTLPKNGRTFYARWDKGEVDLVTLSALLKPTGALEIKWSDRYSNRLNELKSLLSYAKANNLTSVFVTSKTFEGEKEVEGIKIQFVPSALYVYYVGYVCFHNHTDAWSSPIQ
ncbi:MAG: ATP-binding protein [Bacteroidota bacterium]